MSFWPPLLVFLGVIALFVGHLYFFQHRHVYFPEKGLGETPDPWGIPFEDVRFSASDGTGLNGWWVPPTGWEALPVILFCHGNGGNLSAFKSFVRLFHDLGCAAFHFDYRGYGESEGRPGEAGTYRDGEAALAWLETEQNIPRSRIVYFGLSLGGGIATHLARRHPAGGLVLLGTFLSIPEMGREVYPFLPVELLARIRYPNRENLQHYSGPLLIVHSRQDEVIPFRHGERLFEESPSENKTFLPISGSHNDGHDTSGSRFINCLKEFLNVI